LRGSDQLAESSSFKDLIERVVEADHALQEVRAWAFSNPSDARDAVDLYEIFGVPSPVTEEAGLMLLDALSALIEHLLARSEDFQPAHSQIVQRLEEAGTSEVTVRTVENWIK
jgi:hypothetical protein